MEEQNERTNPETMTDEVAESLPEAQKCESVEPEGRPMTAEEEDATKFCKSVRKKCDELLQELKDFRDASPAFGGRDFQRQLSEAITCQESVIMRSGMCLKELRQMTHGDGNGSVYPDSYDPSNTKIAPTLDGLKM